MEYYQIGQYQQRLLQEHSGAAMAYSLRRISSTYTGDAVELYKMDSGETRMVGFDTDDTLKIDSRYRLGRRQDVPDLVRPVGQRPGRRADGPSQDATYQWRASW